MKKFSELTRTELYKAFKNCDFLRERLYEIVRETVEDEIESEIIMLNNGIDDYNFAFPYKDRKTENYLIPQSHRKFIDVLRGCRDKYWYVCHYLDDLDEDLCKCLSDDEVEDVYNWYAPHIIEDIVRSMNYRMEYVDYAFEKFNVDFRAYVDAYGYGTSFDDCYVIDGKIYELHEIGSFE